VLFIGMKSLLQEITKGKKDEEGKIREALDR
jgi:hypothetical protein